MTDREQRLQEIRERYEQTSGEWQPSEFWRARGDVRWLLAEIERLKQDVKRRDLSISQLIKGKSPRPPSLPKNNRPKEYA